MTSSRRPFLEMLEDTAVVFDGAMGTELYRRGIFVNRCFDELTLSAPDLVRQIHQAYLDVGADAVETNTFGANRVKLSKYGFGDQTAAINREAARIARSAAREGAWVAGAIGPLGIRIEPWGPTSVGEAQEYFREQAAALAEGGVDLFILETFSDLNEIHAAIRAVREVSKAPLVASMTIEEDGNSLEGTAPEAFAGRLEEWGADVIGVNCSVGPAAMLAAVERIAESGPDRRISAMPNAGRPRNIDGRNLYLCSPEYMGSYARRFVAAGARVVGGCCGTTPDYIRAISRAVHGLHPSRGGTRAGRTVRAAETPLVQERPREEKSALARDLAGGRFVLAAELIPPRGADAASTLETARSLRTAGASVLVVPERAATSARMTALALAQLVQTGAGVETVVEYSCRDRNLPGMQADLLGAWALGVRNVALVTGAPAIIGDYPGAGGGFDVDAIGLTNMVRRLNRGEDIGGNAIGAPTAFHIGVWANIAAPDPERELARFEWKIDAGAEYALLQSVFDLDRLEKFLKRAGTPRVPMIASVVPLGSLREAEFLNNELPGSPVPPAIVERLRAAEATGRGAEEGVAIALELMERLRGMVEGILVSAPHEEYGVALRLLASLEEKRREP